MCSTLETLVLVNKDLALQLGQDYFAYTLKKFHLFLLTMLSIAGKELFHEQILLSDKDWIHMGGKQQKSDQYEVMRFD